MSEKRFEIFPQNVTKDGTLIIIQNGLKLYNISDVVELLNALYEENEQLRQFINKGRRLSVKELMANTNENELLKKKIKELEKENKELQTELDSFRPVLFHDMRIGTITLYFKDGE